MGLIFNCKVHLGEYETKGDEQKIADVKRCYSSHRDIREASLCADLVLAGESVEFGIELPQKIGICTLDSLLLEDGRTKYLIKNDKGHLIIDSRWKEYGGDRFSNSGSFDVKKAYRFLGILYLEGTCDQR